VPDLSKLSVYQTKDIGDRKLTAFNGSLSNFPLSLQQYNLRNSNFIDALPTASQTNLTAASKLDILKQPTPASMPTSSRINYNSKIMQSLGQQALDQAKEYQSNSGISPLKNKFAKFDNIIVENPLQTQQDNLSGNLDSSSSSHRLKGLEVFRMSRPSTSGSGIGQKDPFTLTLNQTRFAQAGGQIEKQPEKNFAT
jgi:hypothetical protein